MDYYSAIKKNEVLIYTAAWVNEPWRHYVHVRYMKDMNIIWFNGYEMFKTDNSLETK